MTTNSIRAITALAISLASTSALAGGFDRGGVNVDQLFDTERFTLDNSATIVKPRRTIKNVSRSSNVAAAARIDGLDGVADGQLNQAAAVARLGGGAAGAARLGATIAGINAALPAQTADSIDVDNDYVVPRIAAKYSLTDDAACLASYHQPFGADADYGRNNAYSPTSVEFQIKTQDYGLTCSYRFAAGDFSVGQGYVRAIVGGSYQELQAFQSRQTFLDFALAGAAAIPGTLVTNTSGLGSFDVAGDSAAYRLGVAYEIPDIALRAMVLYTSSYDYDLSGVQDSSGFYGQPTGTSTTRVTAQTEIPQSIDVRLQSGINDRTIVFANYRWQEWSKLNVIPIVNGISPVSGAPTNLSFDPRYQDGHTVSAGVGRRLTDEISGLVGLGYDRGTSTITGGQTDTYTLSGGLSIKPHENISVQVGGLVGLLTEGSSGLPPAGGDQANNVTYDFDNDLVYALNLGIKLRF